MEKTVKAVILCIVTSAFLISMGIWLLIKAPEQYSYSERRTLAQDKSFELSAFFNGSFAGKFENYSLDQFPIRDNFRSVKALTERYVLGKKDSNGIYIADGHLSKIEYPVEAVQVERSCEKFRYLYEKYLEPAGITPSFVLIPDKNYYLASKSDVLSMDYEYLYQKVEKETSYMKFIDLRERLTLLDYYQTDTHWRQECIVDVADDIRKEMEITGQEKTQRITAANYEMVTLNTPFYGVYVGQSALPVRPDAMCYLENEQLRACTVMCYDTGKPVEKPMYDMTKATGRDPYELFLNGAAAVITIDNPGASSDKELVMFRDSFGSSLAPLLVSDYRKVTLLDTRYIQPDLIQQFVTFDHQDVLFLYSTLYVNHGL